MFTHAPFFPFLILTIVVITSPGVDTALITKTTIGLLSNALNPKVAVFFLTFLPQFVEPGVNTMEQLFMMGVIYTGLAIVWFWIKTRIRTTVI
ncbi:hypothetical protein AAC03nite_04220 [Alicyclobacillus acidoterrestris]|nr:hypothetical protein AAC03nite_04220 [Alicyclobacillus acidoterrestris]